MPRVLKSKLKPNPHVGSDFEDFLREEGRLELSTSLAIKRMGTNRVEVRRQREEADPAVTLPTLSNDSTVLSQTAFETFVATCNKPPKPTTALRRLVALR